MGALGSAKESLFVLGSSVGRGAWLGSDLVVVMEVGGREEGRVLVVIVRERRGMLSFFVRRMEDAEALVAERRARVSEARGIRRLMVLFSLADWIV